MTALRLGLALTLMLAASVHTAPGLDPQPDFSGTWILDTERSWIETPERHHLPSDTLVVRQTATTLTVDGEPEAHSIALGRRVETRQGGATSETHAKWKGGRLHVVTTWTQPQGHRVAFVMWSVNALGTELTLVGSSFERDVSEPARIVTSRIEFTRVYRKRR